ncbi:DUF2563 family protein [Mycolicibacterium sp. P9-22]|uniref:DUF2563 family protein n=1 Tax=Mycolicibacterium sp. P9-22 TaxID=2024613 RepID=UPI0011EBA983|nr:DUF2563 family protein [Mycolicibacterium sp. P9-22]KAA0115063.1 DUF2563 family protein [Mycolicibacterium sp. P9-22]
MIVDTGLLRMGADFSNSAGTIAQKGAASLAATQLQAGVFGDFAEADDFHRQLSQAQTLYADNMTAYRATFERLAKKSVTAADAFSGEDSDSATRINGAGVTSD